MSSSTLNARTSKWSGKSTRAEQTTRRRTSLQREQPLKAAEESTVGLFYFPVGANGHLPYTYRAAVSWRGCTGNAFACMWTDGQSWPYQVQENSINGTGLSLTSNITGEKEGGFSLCFLCQVRNGVLARRLVFRLDRCFHSCWVE